MVARNCRHKRIKLSQGRFALVDAEDFDRISVHKWYCTKNYRAFYAGRKVRLLHCTAIKRQKTVLMHRVIMKAKLGDCLDHINGNGLDNRKKNLRFCTTSQNQQNRKHKRDNCSSKYRGVTRKAGDKKWHARIKASGTTHSLGYFENEMEAAEAYNAAAKHYYGEFACLNQI